jgi:hypothetical protein
VNRTRVSGVRAASIVVVTIGLMVSWVFAAQAASNVVWNSAFTEKGFAKFRDTPYNDVGAAAPVLVTSTVNPPAKAARFTVPGGGTRSEIEPKVFTFTEGSDYYFGDSFTLPAGFPVAEPSWQVLTQWKNDGDGSPPVEIKVGNGNVFIDGGYGYPKGPAGKKYWCRRSGNSPGLRSSYSPGPGPWWCSTRPALAGPEGPGRGVCGVGSWRRSC